MKMPLINLDSLPGLETAQGLFGSLSHVVSAALDDRVLVVMTYLYEIQPS